MAIIHYKKRHVHDLIHRLNIGFKNFSIVNELTLDGYNRCCEDKWNTIHLAHKELFLRRNVKQYDSLESFKEEYTYKDYLNDLLELDYIDKTNKVFDSLKTSLEEANNKYVSISLNSNELDFINAWQYNSDNQNTKYNSWIGV